MLGLPSALRYFLYRGATDMRKSFRGLCGLVNNHLKMDPTSGDGFIFINKNRTLIKILVWDRNGYVIYYKRLEKGTIEIPKGNDNSIAISVLVMMLEGIDLESASHRKRYRKQVEIHA